MSLGTVLAAACVLLTADTVVAPTDLGWMEQTRLEVAADGRCDYVDVVLPPRSALEARAVRLVRFDRANLRLGDDHWERLDAGLSGDQVVRLHVPELASGDRARIDLEVAHASPDTFRWRTGAGFATLTLAQPLQVTTYGEVRHDRREWWTSDAGAEVRVHRGDPSVPAVPVELPQRFDPPPALTASAAQTDLATLVLIPRGIDGLAPLSGPEALRRGAVDDRGFARTLVMLTAGGPDRVELGAWLPEHNAEGHADVEEGEVAVWFANEGPMVLQHPSAPPRTGRVWSPSGVFTASVEGGDTPFAAAGRDLPRLVQHRAMLIDLPDGDPQTSLYPGGGSRVLVRHGVVFPVDGRARPFVLPVPEGVEDITVTTDPPNVAEPLWTLRLRDHDAALVVGPTPYAFAVLFEWLQGDAPACGLVPTGHEGRWIVDATEGQVTWTGQEAWHLSSWGDSPVVADRDALIRGLERRFAGVSLPEPALPLRLKHARASWELAELLRPTLFERARPAALPLAPGWPRRLSRARRSGAVTTLEAALILRLYANQSGLPATWAMVRPASDGAGAAVCPEAYPEALVRIDFEGDTRWIDPGCEVCAPYELRPHLEGAAALGPGVDRTPPPTEGTWRVEVGAEQVIWRLEGPAALRFRQWLKPLRQADRSGRIAARVGGPGATLASAEGIGTAGDPITLVVNRPDGPFAGEDPIALPSPRSDGTTWLDWVGERRLVMHGAADGVVESTLSVPGASWQRQAADGAVVEVLDVHDRTLSAHAGEKVRHARR